MALTLQERTNLIKLTVGMFNMAPGATYLADITAMYEANGRSLTNVASILAATSVYKTLNPTFQTAAEFAAAFLTPLGLQANTTAVDFVVSRFNSTNGDKGAVALAALTALVNTTAPEFAAAQAILNNKTTVAENYSVTLASAVTNVAQLQQVLAGVTADVATVTTANAVNATTSGQTFTLTTGIDTFTGGAGNDMFIATNAAAGSTLNLGDSLNGGAGTDTLNILSNTASALAGTTTAIEIININQATGAGVASLVASSQAANATNINMTGAGDVTVTGLGATQQVGMIGAVTSGAAASAFTVTQTTNGPLTLNLNGAIGAAARALTFVDAGAATTATINATGTASTLQGVTLPGATSLTVNAAVNVALGGVTDAVLATVVTSGAATTVNLGALNSTVVSSINASGLTAGGVNVTLANGNLATVTFVGGAGNDTLNLGNNIIAGAAGQLNAGAGTGDTLGLTLGTQLTTALAPAYVGFEVLAFGDNAVGQTYNVATLAGITSVTSAGTAGTTTTINGLTALTPQGVTHTGVGALTLGVTNATTVGTLDTVNLTLSSGATPNTAATVETLTVAGVETLNITAATGTATSAVAALSGASLSAINITGNASPVSFTTGVTAIGANLSITSTGTGVHTIDLSGATGNAVSITSGSGNDILSGTGLNDIINGGAGNDTITGGTGADNMTGGAGNDTFVIATRAVTQGAAFTVANTTNANIDKITDFVGAGAAAGDSIKLGLGANVFGGAITFTAATTATVTAVTVATAADFTALAAAIQTASAGVASTNAVAQVYDVTVTAGTLAGHYAVVNDDTLTVAATDTFISITGAAALNAQDITFA